MIKLTYPDFWQRKGVLSYLLLPFSFIYISLGYLRKLFSNKIYLPAKVICIGNYTIGGTGKTQLVIWLSKKLKEKNINFVILSKGFGGKYNIPQIVAASADPFIVGDEAVELANHGTTIIAKKPTHALALLSKLKPDIIIVDDGMQNPNFHKDITISTIDEVRGFGNGFILPAGPLRQKTNSDIVDAAIIISPEEIFKEYYLAKNTEKFFANIQKSDNNQINLDKPYIAFTGIGNPEKFYLTLEQYKIKIIDKIDYPDHFAYDIQDLKHLLSIAKQKKASLITTRKDYVKIKKLNIEAEITCFEVELVVKNEQELLNLIDEKIFQTN